MDVSIYHKTLRTSATILALVLLFQSGVASVTTKQLSLQTEIYIANVVGITASVSENELNMLTAGLEQRKNELDARERNINEIERASTMNENTTYFLAATLFILLILIVLNYVLDFLRSRRILTSVSTSS